MSKPFNLLIIDTSPFHRKSAHCFIIANTWCKTFFQYARVSLIELIKLKALLLAINSLAFALKFLLKIPAVKLFETTFLIAMLIWLLSWILYKTEWAKKYSHYLLPTFEYDVINPGWDIFLSLMEYPFLFGSHIYCLRKDVNVQVLTKFISKNWD